MASEQVQVYFNPRCSKCREARDLLDQREASYELIEYLTTPPSRQNLEQVLTALGTDDPRTITRTKEALYTELSLQDASRDQLLDALVAHPALIERPIVIHRGKAVIARPPEKLLELF